MNGLYGKKPVAKIRIATGISRFASARSTVRGAIAINVVLRPTAVFRLQEEESKERHEDLKKSARTKPSWYYERRDVEAHVQGPKPVHWKRAD